MSGWWYGYDCDAAYDEAEYESGVGSRRDKERDAAIEDGLHGAAEVSAPSGWGAAQSGGSGGDAVPSNDAVVARPG